MNSHRGVPVLISLFFGQDKLAWVGSYENLSPGNAVVLVTQPIRILSVALYGSAQLDTQQLFLNFINIAAQFLITPHFEPRHLNCSHPFSTIFQI